MCQTMGQDFNFFLEQIHGIVRSDDTVPTEFMFFNWNIQVNIISKIKPIGREWIVKRFANISQSLHRVEWNPSANYLTRDFFISYAWLYNSLRLGHFGISQIIKSIYQDTDAFDKFLLGVIIIIITALWAPTSALCQNLDQLRAFQNYH